MTWFKRYNTGASGSGAGSNTGALTMEELKRLLDDLNTEVGLPPLNDDRLLEALFRKFDTNKNGLMEFTEFLNLYFLFCLSISRAILLLTYMNNILYVTPKIRCNSSTSTRSLHKSRTSSRFLYRQEQIWKARRFL